jgi:hypothetical protein
LASVARHYLRRALDEAHGNKTEAAKLVGLPSYQTLSNWLQRLNGIKGVWKDANDDDAVRILPECLASLLTSSADMLLVRRCHAQRSRCSGANAAAQRTVLE